MALVDYNSDSDSDEGFSTKRPGSTIPVPSPKRLKNDTGKKVIELEKIQTESSPSGSLKTGSNFAKSSISGILPLPSFDKVDDRSNNMKSGNESPAKDVSVESHSISAPISRQTQTLGGGVKAKLFDGEIYVPQSTGYANTQIKRVDVVPAAVAARIAKYGSNDPGPQRKALASALLIANAARKEHAKPSLPCLFSATSSSTQIEPAVYQSLSIGPGFDEIPPDMNQDEVSDPTESKVESRRVDISGFLPRNRRGETGITNVVDFNVADFYEENEQLRNSGKLQESKRPVTAVSGGKHQLSSLLRSAQANREKLEEQFAHGKLNKKEASARHGF